MNRKKNLRIRSKGLMVSSMALSGLLFSCAQDGFDDKESFDIGVYDTQLVTPEADEISVTASADGTKQTISWPVVYGAGGYHAVLTNITTEEVKDTIVDGTSFAVDRTEDCNYTLALTVLENTERNNKGGEQVTKDFNTFIVTYKVIPTGTDLCDYFRNNPLPDAFEGDLAYDLEAGGNYTMSDTLNAGNKYLILRTKDNNYATITCAQGACFMFGNGLRLQNLNIDSSGNTANGLLLMSDTPDESLSTEALGYKAKGANQNGYVMQNPVMLKNVNVKGLKKSLIYGNKKPWSLTSLVINNCIVQADNADNSNGMINMYGGGNGLIKSLTVANSTFFNLQKNASAYFLRYSNTSNAQPQKIFGTGETATLTLSNNTFANVYTGKDFGNNLANTNLVTTILTDNIFYDVFRVYQIVQTNTNRTTTNNYIWWVNTAKQANDTSRTDSNGNPICTEADPGFPTIEQLTALDFTQENCGANFTPSGTPLTNKAGDPRWLP